MRHKYQTRGIVLSRTSVGEASVFVMLLTEELGLIRALVQGVRKSGAKLASSLTTFSESDVVLVRGKDGWRVAGAVLCENWFLLLTQEGRVRVARVASLLLRLVAGEAHEQRTFLIMRGYLSALTEAGEDTYEPLEILAALRILAALGFDAGTIPGDEHLFTPEVLSEVVHARTAYITRINTGITASGL